MPKIARKIKHIDNDFKSDLTTLIHKNNNMDAFAALCEQFVESDWLHEEKTINIQPTENLPLLSLGNDSSLKKARDLSFKISDEDIIKIVDQIAALMRNPTVLAEQLKDLDNELGATMHDHKVHFNDGDLPAFLIAGNTHFIPAPPPDDYLPKKKARILDTLLLTREKKHGINTDGITPKFSGAVNSYTANSLVSSGHLFSEDKQVSRLLLHGSYTHRLAFEAIRNAVQAGKVSLKYDGNKELTMKQLLELLVHVDYSTGKGYSEYSISLWAILLDTTRDSTPLKYNSDAYENSGYFHLDQYSFSSCSPFVFNSLLLCFGKDLGLPNLQHYLLDSHYKAAFEMVQRVRMAMPSFTTISNSALYFFCIETLSIAAEYTPGNIGVAPPFTLPAFQEKKDQDHNDHRRYLPFSYYRDSGIMQKEKSASVAGQYASWQNFFDSKQSIFSKTDKMTENTATTSAFSENNNTTENQSLSSRLKQ